mmetsp:Transcript_21603/g.31630  ORF Transcript_21603/g.31630 Transcript_21603/m.31630 type:complete len:89 (+) Transcript_21603:47-313(+)
MACNKAEPLKQIQPFSQLPASSCGGVWVGLAVCGKACKESLLTSELCGVQNCEGRLIFAPTQSWDAHCETLQTLSQLEAPWHFCQRHT